MSPGTNRNAPFNPRGAIDARHLERRIRLDLESEGHPDPTTYIASHDGGATWEIAIVTASHTYVATSEPHYTRIKHNILRDLKPDKEKHHGNQ